MHKLFILREALHLASLVSFLTANWKAFADQGRFLAVTVQVYRSKRSLEQNRRYFGPAVLGAIVDQAWVDGRRYDKQSWHDYFCRQFIGVIELPFGGTRAMHSSDLDIEEFSEFMQEVEAYAAQELGVRFT